VNELMRYDNNNLIESPAAIIFPHLCFIEASGSPYRVNFDFLCSLDNGIPAVSDNSRGFLLLLQRLLIPIHYFNTLCFRNSLENLPAQ
jgi:hypothetical protein